MMTIALLDRQSLCQLPLPLPDAIYGLVHVAGHDDQPTDVWDAARDGLYAELRGFLAC